MERFWYTLLGTASIVTFWTAAYLMVIRWQGDRSLPLSKHAASNKGAYTLFSIVSSLTLIGFYFFGSQWLLPALHLSSIAQALLLISTTSLVATVLVPDTGRVLHRIHSSCALFGTLLMLPLPIFIATSNYAGSTVSIIAIIGLMIMLVSGGFFFLKRSKRYQLLTEAGYFGTFHAILLLAAYFL